MMAHRLWLNGLGIAALLSGASGCGVADLDLGDPGDNSLRAALTRSSEDLELTDLPSRRAIGERTLAAAREQAEASEVEQIDAGEGLAPIDAVSTADADRAVRALEPLIAAALRTEAQATTLRATGARELFTADRLIGAAVAGEVRVDSSFPGEPSEALGGRSEAQVVAELSGLIDELGRAVDPAVTSWVVVRRAGLHAGLVFLASAGVVELNPALIYYWSPLTQPAPAVGVVPTTVGASTGERPANDWEVLMRWLGQADPPTWTNLGGGVSQTDDGGFTDPTTTYPTQCCCPCSAFGPDRSGWHGRAAIALAMALPLGLLFVARRRTR